MTLDLRRLEHFLAIVEHDGMTAAAERLHLTQQALSSSLSQFERQLGVELFARQGRRLELTAAGRALLAAGPGVLAAARDAVVETREAGRREPAPLRIGRSPAVTGERAAALLAPLGEEPRLPVEVTQRFPEELYDALVSGALDLALVRGNPHTSGTGVRTLAFDRLRVAVPAAHPLSQRASVRLEELAGCPIAVWGDPARSAYTAFLVDLCLSAGFTPDIRRVARQGMPPVTAAEGDQVAFVTEPAGPAADGRVQVVDLDPATYAPLNAVWVGARPTRRVAAALDRCAAIGQRVV